MEYIIPLCIFVTTFVFICILYDCILRARMEKRMLETWEFIDTMKDFVVETEIPERIPF